MANNSNITNLDFADIKKQLKDFMKNQSEFTDYDFEGSGINTLIDVLAYNTHMNAMMAHMVMNESFLDTAQVRSNVVSHAQLIGYTPRSNQASRAELDVVVQGDALSPGSLTLAKGTKFIGKINNTEYTFVANTSYVEPKLDDNSYVFNNVAVYEGVINTEKYLIDGLVPNQYFEIASDAVDIDSVRVIVYANENTQIGAEYSRFESTATIGPSSNIFFIKENQFGKYYVYFGDGYTGTKPESGSYVEIEYLTTKGEEANNIISMTAASDIGGEANISVEFSDSYEMTVGGRDREGVEDIRYNAPIKYATQDRAVTTRDYRALILQEFPVLSDVSVWGGEEADPPQYGKVFITPVITDATNVTQAVKNSILNYIRLKNVSSVIPEIIDAEYTYIKLFAGVQYDINKTSKTVGEIKAAVAAAIDQYNDTVLSKFSSVFQLSRILAAIDNSDSGVTSSIVKTTLYKEFRPAPGVVSNYVLKYPSKFYIDEAEVNISSNDFYIDGVRARMADGPHPTDDTKRSVYFYNVSTAAKISGYENVGELDIEAGTIILYSVNFDQTNVIKVYASPNSYNIAPIYNQLLNINGEDITIEMVEDTVSILGASGLPTYKPFERH